MAIPLYIFLYIYWAFVVICLIFAVFNIYHVIRFGSLNQTTVFSSFIFVIGIIIILWIANKWLSTVNWQEIIEFF